MVWLNPGIFFVLKSHLRVHPKVLLGSGHEGSSRYCVDATQMKGRKGRLVNHCRLGNCAPQLMYVEDKPRVILMATRNIEPGEEILFDYGDRTKESIEAHPWLAS